MSGFTPGPWNVRRGTFVYAGIPEVLISEVFPYAHIEESKGSYDRAEANANADLIAAAPDMYEAITSALEWMHDPEADALEQFERIGQLFYKDTGYLRPGKSYPMDSHVPEDCEKVWAAWRNQRQAAVITAFIAAIAKAEGEK
jgi:hypothetical protein